MSQPKISGNFVGISLRASVLSHVDATGVNFFRADLSQVRMESGDFSGANLSEANLSNAVLSYGNFRNACLRKSLLKEANLSQVNLELADLSHANLEQANLYRASLSQSNLTGANLMSADLQSADLWDANLSRANLNQANLTDADLSEVNLAGTSLVGATLKGVEGLVSPKAELEMIEQAYDLIQSNPKILNMQSQCLSIPSGIEDILAEPERPRCFAGLVQLLLAKQGDLSCLQHAQVVGSTYTPTLADRFYGTNEEILSKIKAILEGEIDLLKR